MKLRLNLTLRRCLLSAFAVVATLSTGNVAQGSVLYSSVGMQTYTDFGQNCGRYQAGRVNDLLSSIRREEGGVKIYYFGEKFENYSFTLPHGMIDFSSGSAASVDAAIGYGFLATVQHNGVQNPAYAAPEVGGDNAVRYAGIEYRNGNIGLGEAANEVFLYCPHTDYKITRLSKLVTDVRTSDVYNNMEMLGQPLTGQFLYRAGSGAMKMAQVDENGMANASAATGLRGAYSYVTGGLITIDGWGQRETQEGGDFNYSVNHTVPADIYGYITGKQASGQVNPLPYVSQGGDSGSPSWVWNEKTQTYQYISALQSGGGTYSQDRGAWYWTLEKMESFNKRKELGEDSLIRFTAVNQEGCTISGNADNTTLTVTQHLGSILYGGETIQFAGNQLNTWADLNDLRDEENWYNYGNEYLNANGNVSKADDGKISYGELMHTDSIILTATTESPYTVQLDDTVDTGIGFVQFSMADGVESATFNLVSENGEQNQLNTAGFVVDAGVTLNISLTGDSAYLREWRKVGEGDLRISGCGNNDILLNVGGGSTGTNDGSNNGHTSGKVYLDRTDGYAAYNVLASTGSTIVLSNTQQVKHDVTLGAGGATLDLNGNDYTWNNSAENNDVFTLHMLTEKDILANHGESAATVTIKDAGDTLLGSFEDSESGALKVIYDGGDKALAMHSVFTDLKHNRDRDSGFTVKSGSVSLGGTMTVHGTGSLTGTNTDRVENPNDWHYADAKMDVTVQKGATFTLDSHARLTGDVTVEDGGTFVMKEGTKHQYEYIEGGFFAEDTQNAFYSQFHGLKGNITLNGGALNIVYNTGVDAHNTYAGSISGSGSMQIELGTDGAILTLGGDNSQFTPEIIEAVSGGVIAESKKAIGAKKDQASIRLHEKAWLGVKGAAAADILPYITTDSAGVLALTQNEEQQLGLGAFAHLIIGALEGMSIEYGLLGTDAKLMANADNQWLLGGGGGELVVNFALQNENGTLVLGNEYTTGSVKLTNTGNSFKAIDFRGLVTLEYEEGTLGGADIHLNYGNRVLGSDSTMLLLNDNVSGTMLLDKMAAENLNLGNRTSLYLGTSQNITYTGTITTADNTYRLGGTTGTLSLAQALKGDRNLSVDGQHYSGGVIELQQPTSLTGHVTVMGYDSTQTDRTGGDITLRLCQDNSLEKAVSVTLKDGGILDVNGTRQQLNNLSMAAGSVLKNSSLEHGSSVEALLHQDTTLQGTIAVDTFTLSVGKGTTATLGGEVKVNTLTKSDEGALMLMLDGAFTGNLNIDGGTVKISNDHALGAYNTDGSRSIAINQGGTLDYCGIKDNEMAYAITLNGGTLTNSGDNIGNNSRQLITKLTVTADSFIDSSNNFGLIANGYNTTSLDLNGGSLEKKGSGTYHIVNADITAKNGGVLKVSKGTLDFNRGAQGTAAVSRLGADLEAAGGTTCGTVQLSKDITVTLSGGVLSAAFDTVEQQLTFDTALTNATASSAISGNGTVRKTGSGTLELTSASTLHHVSVENGKLVLSSAGADIEGNVSIATGATLEMGSNLNLRSGQTLSVIGNSSTPATLGSVLELNGGSLAFDGNALSNEQYALSVDGLTKSASGLTINFFNTSYLTDGATYKLVSGDWSALNPGDDFFTVTSMEYFTSSLKKGTDGLSVTFSLAENCFVWDGTPDRQIWSSAAFGQQQRTTTDENILVFNDSASSKTIVVEGSQLARSLVFDTLGHYTVDTTRGSVQTTDVDVYNDGNATLGSGVTVSGEALVGRGSLTVTDTATLEHAQSIRGDGTLVIDWGHESGTVSAINELHTLTVKSGQFNAEVTVQTDVVTVQNGGQFNAAGTTQTAAFILSGKGRTEAEDKSALVLNNGASISGALLLNGDAAIEVAAANNGTATLNGAINGGEYTLSKNGAGTLGISAVSAMELKGLTVEEGTVLMHRNNSVAKNIGTLQLNNGTTFTQYSDEEPNSNASAAIETLVMGGSSATLKSTNHAGSFNIGTLNKAVGVTNASLTLDNNSSVMQYSVFTLGQADADAGNYDGFLNLKSTHGGEKRHAAIVINNGEITRNTLINLESTVSGSANLALGLHDDTVTVAGLASGKSLGSRAFLFSGDAVANKDDIRKEDIGRTLAVNTAAETDAVFNGAVDANINIIKSGVGSQTFAGTSTSFNGTITVQDGTLGLYDTRMLRQATEITIDSSGTMKLDGLMALDSTVIHNNGTLIFGSNTQYILGDISTPTTYTLVNGSGNTAGLSLANFFYNGQSLLGYSAGVRLLFSDNAVTLNITETPDSRTIMWNGTGESAVWDNGVTTAWTYEGDATESYYRTDSVVFGAAGDKNVSIANGTATNAMTVQAGDYSFTGMAGLTVNGTLSINEGASATFDALTANQTQQITANGAVTAGATEITDGTATFNSTAHFTNGIRIDGGTTTFNDTVTVDATAADYEMVINRGTVAINRQMTVNGNVQLGENKEGTANSLIIIGKQGVLSVGKLNSAWGFDTLTVNGVVNTTYFNLSTGTTQTITGSGTINADHLTGGNNGIYNFSGVRLNIGNGGMDGGRPLSFTDMTLGALDNWTVNRNITLAGNITIDTARYDKASGQDTAEGTTITLSNITTSELTSLTKTGEGTLALNAAHFNGSNAFNLTLDGGTLKLNNAVLSLHGGILNITGNTTIDVSGVNVDTITKVSAYQDGSDHTNGYLQGTYQALVSGGTAGMAEGVTLTAGEGLSGKTLELFDDSICLKERTPDNIVNHYFIHSETNYGNNEANTAYNRADALVLNAGDAVLNLKTNLNGKVCTGGIVTEVAGGLVNIGQGVTLKTSDLHATKDVKLGGNGVYEMSQVTRPEHISWDENWQGTVDIVSFAGSTDTNIKLEELGRAGSSIRLNGTQGYLTKNTEIAADVELNGPAALKITNGYSDTGITFNGAIKGNGNLEKNWASGGSSCNLEFDFNGDTSAWTGAFVNSAWKGDSTLVFAAGAKKMGAAIQTTSTAKTHIEVGTDTAAAEIIFKNTIQASSLNLQGESSATLQNNAALGQVESHSGTLVLENTARLGLSTTDTDNLSGAKLKLSAHNTPRGGSISGSIRFNVDGDNTYTVSGTEETMGRLDNTLLELADATSLKLEHIVVTADSVLQAENSGELQVQNVVLNATIGTNATIHELNQGYQAMSLAATDTPTPTPTADAVLTLGNLQNLTLTGDSLTINLSMDYNILQELANQYKWVGITLEPLSDFEDVTSVAVSCNGVLLENTFRSEDGGMVLFDTSAVPEPTTGTLSLLALTALCARRRRK